MWALLICTVGETWASGRSLCCSPDVALQNTLCSVALSIPALSAPCGNNLGAAISPLECPFLQEGFQRPKSFHTADSFNSYITTRNILNTDGQNKGPEASGNVAETHSWRVLGPGSEVQQVDARAGAVDRDPGPAALWIATRRTGIS